MGPEMESIATLLATAATVHGYNAGSTTRTTFFLSRWQERHSFSSAPCRGSSVCSASKSMSNGDSSGFAASAEPRSRATRTPSKDFLQWGAINPPQKAMSPFVVHDIVHDIYISGFSWEKLKCSQLNHVSSDLWDWISLVCWLLILNDVWTLLAEGTSQLL